MRSLLLAVAATLALGATAARANTILDATGDFLSTYTGPQDADLDVTSLAVDFDPGAAGFNVSATFAGAINANQPGSYVFGVNTGTGVNHPFGPIGNPNVLFNQAFVIQKTGVGTLGGNPLIATVSGSSLSFFVALSRLPSTGFQPTEYGFSLWPRSGAGLGLISDFAPNNSTLTAVPEPTTWAMMVFGFGVIGAAVRRRRTALAAAIG